MTRFLHTDDIDLLASKNKYLKSVFLGTFPADVIPYDDKNDNPPYCCWIWNIDDSRHEGRHWIAIWVEDGHMILFDSFGKTIEEYNIPIWKKFAEKNNLKLRYHGRHFYQNIATKTCGMWSLMYLYQKSYNAVKSKQKNIFSRFRFIQTDKLVRFSSKKFPKPFLRTTLNNEKKLFKLANKIFKTDVKNIYRKNCRRAKDRQICKTFIDLK